MVKKLFFSIFQHDFSGCVLKSILPPMLRFSSARMQVKTSKRSLLEVLTLDDVDVRLNEKIKSLLGIDKAVFFALVNKAFGIIKVPAIRLHSSLNYMAPGKYAMQYA